MQQTLLTGLTPARIAHIKSLYQDLKAELDFLVQLQAEERSRLNAVAEGRLPFIKEAAEVVENYGDDLAMPSDEIGSLTVHFADYNDMHMLMGLFASLFEGISDTTMLLGAICYDKCRLVRKYVELAIMRGVPGMETVYQDLSHLWERSNPPRENGNGSNGGANPPVPGIDPKV